MVSPPSGTEGGRGLNNSNTSQPALFQGAGAHVRLPLPHFQRQDPAFGPTVAVLHRSGDEGREAPDRGDDTDHDVDHGPPYRRLG